ncbi:MAG: TatD family hydrolase [Candidatus Thiodiazotropha sp.]
MLHCRGMEKEDNTEAYNLLLKTLRCSLGQGALIHLHCFNGSQAVVDMWLANFPNTYFGFTRLVGSFSEEQARAARGLHEGRLLIETDAPYFPFGRSRHSSPAVIGMIAVDLAKIRGVDWQAILHVTRENTKRQNGQHCPPALD